MLHELTHRHDGLVGPAGELEVCAWRGTRVVRRVLYRPYPHARVYSLGVAQLEAVLTAKSPEEAMAALRTQSGVQAGVDKRS
jgi:hypothetical protein